MSTEIYLLLESGAKFSLDFRLCLSMKTEIYKVKVDTRDELPARILDAADRTKGT